MERSVLIRERLFECIHKGEINNEDLVQIIEHSSVILGLKTLTNYAKPENISYNGAKKRNLNTTNINGVNFIIDNN